MILVLLQAPDTTGTARRILDTVGGFTDYILDYAIALAAVGALAMALIEAAKKVFDSRTRFHAKRWTAWMMKSGDGAVGIAERRKAYADLIQLCTGVTPAEAQSAMQALADSGGRLSMLHGWDPTPANAVFSLDVARMMGAIQDAGDLALASPDRYGALFTILTAGALPADIETWVQRRGEVKDQADAFARLRQIFKRKLDSFQVYTEQRWASYNQFAANAVGALIMGAALISLQSTLGLGLTSVIILSAFGGILSPIAKDLVAALRRVRDG